MARHEEITAYRIAVAANAAGHDDWRATIVLGTGTEVGAQLRFVDDPGGFQERVVEDGVSVVYLSVDRLVEFHHLVQTERPLWLTINDGRLLVQSGQEPIGEEERR